MRSVTCKNNVGRPGAQPSRASQNGHCKENQQNRENDSFHRDVCSWNSLDLSYAEAFINGRLKPDASKPQARRLVEER